MAMDTAIADEPEISVLSFKGEHMAISGIGVVHGLASNDELLILLTLSLGLSTFGLMFVGLTVFTLGVVLGMIMFSILVKLPFKKYRNESVIRVINVTISLITLAYGLYSLLGGETINLFPVVSDDMTGSLMVLSLLLGMKHSLDADHVVAISSILLRAPSMRNTVTLSVSWALGHMLTASVITFVLFTFRELVLEQVLENFESLVAIMLIAIALLTLAWEFDFIRFGKHTHSHDDGTVHRH